jgi:hypothetical protein
MSCTSQAYITAEKMIRFYYSCGGKSEAAARLNNICRGIYALSLSLSLSLSAARWFK